MTDVCSWDNPGAHPYTGNVPAAVYAYAEIPRETADRLFARMSRHQFDDVAEITRDRIVGTSEYTDLRGMHFGKKSICANKVTRDKWGDRREHGLVYCEGLHCLIVPTVCNNVALVTRVVPLTLPEPPTAIAPPDGGTWIAPPPSPLTYLAPPAPPAEEQFPTLPMPWPYSDGFYGGGSSFVIGRAPPVLAIPEPATWALMIAGCVAIGLSRRFWRDASPWRPGQQPRAQAAQRLP